MGIFSSSCTTTKCSKTRRLSSNGLFREGGGGTTIGAGGFAVEGRDGADDEEEDDPNGHMVARYTRYTTQYRDDPKILIEEKLELKGKWRKWRK